MKLQMIRIDQIFNKIVMINPEKDKRSEYIFYYLTCRGDLICHFTLNFMLLIILNHISLRSSRVFLINITGLLT